MGKRIDGNDSSYQAGFSINFKDLIKNRTTSTVALFVGVVFAAATIYGGCALKGIVPNPLSNHWKILLGAEIAAGATTTLSAIAFIAGLVIRKQGQVKFENDEYGNYNNIFADDEPNNNSQPTAFDPSIPVVLKKDENGSFNFI